MPDYLREKLRERSLVEIVENCRSALRRGYLDDAEWEKAGIMGVVRMRSFAEFEEGRTRAFGNYDRFCSMLESTLPTIESKTDDTEKLRALRPLYRDALKYDGERRFFDRGLNDEFGDTILADGIGKIKRMLKSVGAEDALFDIVNGHSFMTFRTEMLRDYLRLLGVIPEELKKRRLAAEDIRGMPESAKSEFDSLAAKYAHGSAENNLARLNNYLAFAGRESSVIADVDARKKEAVERRKIALERVSGPLEAAGKKQKFMETLVMVDRLNFYNTYEDEYRHARLDALADYFLREDVAIALHGLGRLESPVPTDYPQRHLLAKMDEVLDHGSGV